MENRMECNAILGNKYKVTGNGSTVGSVSHTFNIGEIVKCTGDAASRIPAFENEYGYSQYVHLEDVEPVLCLKMRLHKTLDELVIQWAADRNILEGSTRKDQMTKLMEEIGELASGIAKGKEPLVKDSIGDVLVVLIILAKQSGTSIEECLNLAWNEIKDRKGKMVDGIFIKEG